MYLESLIRLAEILDHHKSNGTFLVDEKFHKDTEDLIESQTKFLIADLQFRKNNPGPYDFGFEDLTVTFFSPDQTELQEWACIARADDWQKNYRFNSIMGMVKILSLIFEDYSKRAE